MKECRASSSVSLLATHLLDDVWASNVQISRILDHEREVGECWGVHSSPSRWTHDHRYLWNDTRGLQWMHQEQNSIGLISPLNHLVQTSCIPYNVLPPNMKGHELSKLSDYNWWQESTLEHTEAQSAEQEPTLPWHSVERFQHILPKPPHLA